jgi:RHH-type proline utilization regulon transcriptional repressor/proline dehydrogenase/delta 1-pyrroline-5-carboxylate dehydrogenase
MAYLVRRLLENTSNESFLRKEYVESQPLARLLAPPVAPAPSAAARASDSMQGFMNEPHSDFSQATVRHAMQEEIASVRSQLGRRWDAGSSSPPLTGPWLTSHNPFCPDQSVASVRGAALSDLGRAIQQAQSHADSWRRRSADERAAILRQAASDMSRRRFELAAWEVFEVGKPWREADADVAEAVDFLRYYGDEICRLSRPARLGNRPGELNHRVYSPRGVTAVIAPWNWPVLNSMRAVLPAIVAGNAVVLKPSEATSHTALLMRDLADQAGWPDDVFLVATGGAATGAGHPRGHPNAGASRARAPPPRPRHSLDLEGGRGAQ